MAVSKDMTPALRKVLGMLATSKVLVGIPAEGASRSEGGINNAALGYLFEHGSPETNMPPRPWLVPGVQAARDEISQHLAIGARNAIQATLHSNGDVRAGRAEADKALHRVGLVAQNSMRGRIQSGIAPALSERTIYARLHRRRNRRSPGPMTPLIDTGVFLKSITYAVRLKG